MTAELVGRDRALSELVALLDDAREGRGRSVLLLGEPGIGKSTLAEAVAAHAAALGFRTVLGRRHAAVLAVAAGPGRVLLP
jgi:predicted ATPase